EPAHRLFLDVGSVLFLRDIDDEQPLRLLADGNSRDDLLALGIDGRYFTLAPRGDVAGLAVGSERQPVDLAADRNGRNLLGPIAGDLIDMDVEVLDVAFPDFLLVGPNPQ